MLMVCPILSFKVHAVVCIHNNLTDPCVCSCRHDWYQTESQVIVTVMAKNVPKDGVRVSFMEKEVRHLSAVLK